MKKNLNMTLSNMTLKEKLGQLIIAGFDGYEYNVHLQTLIREYKVANIILFSRNIQNIKQLITLNKEIYEEVQKYTQTIPFISIDQEGGMVTRIMEGATFCPGNMTLTATNNSHNAYKIGQIMGQELIRLGINFNLAPSLDVNNNPENPVIGVRSYSDDPQVVSEFGCQYIKGLQEQGVIATGKHFPGHGDTNVDSHLGLPVIKADYSRLEKVELVPFKKAIEKGIKAIMSAHIVFEKIDPSGLPGTLSTEILTNLLRKKLGFTGIVVSDCMQMKAIDVKYTAERGTVMGIKAGLDIACVSHSLEKQIAALKLLEEAVLSGEISERIIDEKVERILKQKQEINSLLQKRFLDISIDDLLSTFQDLSNAEFASSIVDQSLTLFKGVPYQAQEKTLVIAAAPFAMTIAEDKLDNRSIIDMVRRQIPNLDVIKMDLKAPDYEEIIRKAKSYQQIVVCSYNVNNYPKQIELIQKLNKFSSQLYVISTRNPYEYMSLEGVDNICCLYEYTPNSIQTIIKYLKGEIKPQGKYPLQIKKKLNVSASLYVGLEEYSLKQNLEYLQILANAGIDKVFISAHMPEMKTNFIEELKVITNTALNLNLKIILDVNKKMLSLLEEAGVLENIYALRLDYGFSNQEILKMLDNTYKIELNASAIKDETLAYLQAHGVNFSEMRISHNFFPKPYTGLSYQTVKDKNKKLHQLGFHVVMYIPSQNQKRPPLFDGLPTIEEHRYANIDSVLSDAVILNCDEVCFGDAFASFSEIERAINFNSEIVQIPIVLTTKISEAIKNELLKIHYNRLDASEYMIRSSVRATDIEILVTQKRQRKDVTIDNSLFKRYQGEIGIILKDLPEDNRVNVIGRCLCSDYLLDNILPGQAFKFIIIEEKNE